MGCNLIFYCNVDNQNNEILKKEKTYYFKIQRLKCQIIVILLAIINKIFIKNV